MIIIIINSFYIRVSISIITLQFVYYNIIIFLIYKYNYIFFLVQMLPCDNGAEGNLRECVVIILTKPVSYKNV